MQSLDTLVPSGVFSSREPLSCYLSRDSLAHVMLPLSQALLLRRLFCHLIYHSFQLPAWSEKLEGEFGIQWHYTSLFCVLIIPPSETASLPAGNICAFGKPFRVFS